MRFIIEFIVKCWCVATYRSDRFTHDPQVISQGYTALLNRHEPLA